MTASPIFIPAIVCSVTILLWATAKLPEYLTALMFFAVAMVLSLAPADIIFAGFRSSAFWLILSGFVLGTALKKVGLADRVARLLAAHISGSWPRMVGGIVLLTYALAFVMPSNMGRIALLMPIVMALADRAGLGAGTSGRHGLALAVGFGTFQLSASILPANVPNMIMAGAAESAYQVHFSYLSYLFLHMPVLGILKGLVLATCICIMFPASPAPIQVTEDTKPMSRAEKRLAIMLIITLGLWMTDTVHGIQPAWVGLAAACLCLLPKIGFLNEEEFAKGINIKTCIFIAGILGVATYVVYSGLGQAINDYLLGFLPLDPAYPFRDFASLAGLTTILNFVVTANGVPALYTPLAQSLADNTGFSLVTVLMIQVIGYATPVLPYQSAPIAVAMGMERVPMRDGMKLCLAIALITFLVLLPIDYFWFSLLGWI
ncbi:SLC13 family permease [Microvirga sp. W0021]|uniref:SLC13 family permease n=1 Tax=Hohaiivirga grylli TaxID=3133970 RepID=A0ABV0BKI5_9HYPH